MYNLPFLFREFNSSAQHLLIRKAICDKLVFMEGNDPKLTDPQESTPAEQNVNQHTLHVEPD